MLGPRRVIVALGAAFVGALIMAPNSLASGPAAASGGGAAISLNAPAQPTEFGKETTISGAVVPATGGVEVVVERVGGAGKPLGVSTSADDGSFAIPFSLKRPGSIIVRAAALAATSEAVEIVVRPRITLRVGRTSAFADATAKLTVEPADASGIATLLVKRKGTIVQTARTRVRKGRAVETIVAPGPGAYSVVVEFDAPRGYAKTTAKTAARATTRSLSAGTKGRDVTGLIRRLRALNLHAPVPSQNFTRSLVDTVIAFQKTEGLPRTGTVGKRDWQALARAEPIQATRKGPPNRIEIDKTRQILIKVRGGKVAGVLPVSTGATGNTPEGVHEIRWKAPATTTWLGPGILYRTLTFWGNAFAIHGWSSVPAYPASHGCVRVPIWTADWLYDRSPVGETVIVHR